MKVSILIPIFAIIVACAGKHEEIHEIKDTSDVIQQSQSNQPRDSLLPIAHVLENEINSYVLRPSDSASTSESFFVYAYSQNTDTIVVFGKQPYVLLIWPDFAFGKREHSPPKVSCFFTYKGNPVVVYDSQHLLEMDLCQKMRGQDSVPEIYQINPDRFNSPRFEFMHRYRLIEGHYVPFDTTKAIVMK